MVRDATDLMQWEENLADRLRDLVLIGELELTPEEVAELGRIIASVVKRCHERGLKAEKVLEEKYACAFVTFLVFQGRDGYEEGTYWPAVQTVIGERFNTSEWGRIFERVVDDLGLSRSFEGLRYVSPILGHGGIPTDCLPDFFSTLLQPSETRKEWAALETPKLIQTWLTYANSHQIDKPIVRFLRNGGAVAEDFVDRCRQMARLAADGECLLPDGAPGGRR